MNHRHAHPVESAAARAPAVLPRLLVLDDNARVAQWFRDHVAARYEVIGAGSAAAARVALAQREVAVLVAGETVGGQATSALLHAMRLQAPALMTIMLTRTNDAERILALINEAGVCRVLLEPVRTDAAEEALDAALALHVRLRARPTTLRQDAGNVAVGAATPAPSRPWGLQRVRAWFGRGRKVAQGGDTAR